MEMLNISFNIKDLDELQLKVKKADALMSSRIPYSEDIDPIILPAVEILNRHGFKTFESCQGGKGHCYTEPTVRFYGDDFDLIRAYETCESYKLNVSEVKRVFIKVDIYKDNISANKMPLGLVWGKPFNEITFSIHSQTGTIYRPC